MLVTQAVFSENINLGRCYLMDQFGKCLQGTHPGRPMSYSCNIEGETSLAALDGSFLGLPQDALETGKVPLRAGHITSGCCEGESIRKI
jgi:hypothetical protein